MNSAFRIVAAPYLNSKPLTFGLDVAHAPPAECARRLAEGGGDGERERRRQRPRERDCPRPRSHPTLRLSV